MMCNWQSSPKCSPVVRRLLDHMSCLHLEILQEQYLSGQYLSVVVMPDVMSVIWLCVVQVSPWMPDPYDEHHTK